MVHLFRWQHRNDANILFLKYEDMKADTAAVIRQIAAFIGVTDLTEPQGEQPRRTLYFRYYLCTEGHLNPFTADANSSLI
jgi:hypothetical protein